MTIHQSARYQVTAPEAGKVKAAIAAFAGYVANEPGSRMSHRVAAEDDPTKVVHLIQFADQSAHQAYGTPDAVRKFRNRH